MFIKNKTLQIIVCILLALIILYTGISCIATYIRASSQPYLTSGALRFDFLGYYIIAAINGAVCIASAIVLILFRLKIKKSK